MLGPISHLPLHLSTTTGSRRDSPVVSGRDSKYQAALERAVQDGNIAAANHALKKGADPDRMLQASASIKNDEMYALLIFASHQRILYPPKATSRNCFGMVVATMCAPRQSRLDNALRKMQYGTDGEHWKIAEDFLRQYIGHDPGSTLNPEHIRLAWGKAEAEGNDAILCAILLLGYASKDRFFRAREGRIARPEVREVAKSMPYFPRKHGPLEDWNKHGTKFPGTNTRIWCRHLTTHQIEELQTNPTGKFPYQEHFKSLETIAAHVSPDTEGNFNHFIRHAEDARMFHNHDFGKEIATHFAEMEEGPEMHLGEVRSRRIMLLSNSHAMSIELKIRNKNGKKSYVVKLYDPNVTNSHVRMACGNLEEFRVKTLEQFMKDAATYQRYYREEKEGDAVSVMMVCPKEAKRAPGASVQPVAPNRKLAHSIESKDVTPMAFLQMSVLGFAGNIRDIKNEMKTWEAERIIKVMNAKNSMGSSALYSIVRQKHFDSIKAYGELLGALSEKLSSQQIFKLLEARKPDGTSVFQMAREMKKSPEIIEAYVELAMLLPEYLRARLLAEKSVNS